MFGIDTALSTFVGWLNEAVALGKCEKSELDLGNFHVEYVVSDGHLELVVNYDQGRGGKCTASCSKESSSKDDAECKERMKVMGEFTEYLKSLDDALFSKAVKRLDSETKTAFYRAPKGKLPAAEMRDLLAKFRGVVNNCIADEIKRLKSQMSTGADGDADACRG